MSTGYVYLIRASDTNHYKIGFTTKTPDERRASLQTGNPHKLEVICSWAGSLDDEKKLHSLLSPFRQEGEWFDLTVANLIGLLCQYEAQVEYEQSILTDEEVDQRIVEDIKTFYFTHGPYSSDGGRVEVSEGIRELVRLRLLDFRLWKWYTISDLKDILPFDPSEEVGGQSLFAICLEEGWVQHCQDEYRIEPGMNGTGFEFFMTHSGHLGATD